MGEGDIGFSKDIHHGEKPLLQTLRAAVLEAQQAEQNQALSFRFLFRALFHEILFHKQRREIALSGKKQTQLVHEMKIFPLQKK